MAGLFIDDDFALHLREDFTHRFEIEPLPGDLGRFGVRGELRLEAVGVAARFIDALERVAFGFADLLLGQAAGVRDGFVVLAVGDIDGLLLLLLRLVYLIEGGLHGSGRMHVFELHLHDRDAQAVEIGQLLELDERFAFHLLSSDREHFIHRAVADHFAHGGFAWHRAE